jgi:hypothetical protein
VLSVCTSILRSTCITCVFDCAFVLGHFLTFILHVYFENEVRNRIFVSKEVKTGEWRKLHEVRVSLGVEYEVHYVLECETLQFFG